MSRHRKYTLAQYNLTQADFDKLVLDQGFKCAICEIIPIASETLPSGLYVDYDHRTNKVRGLLCRRCNIAIGMIKEDIFALRNAALYLEKSIYNT